MNKDERVAIERVYKVAKQIYDTSEYKPGLLEVELFRAIVGCESALLGDDIRKSKRA